MKQCKRLIVGMFMLMNTVLYASTVNMAPIITYVLSSTPSGLTFENNTPIPIIDDGIGGPVTTSEINITGTETSIAKVTVTLDITHSWISDLVIRLVSPSGTSIILSNVNIPDAINYENTTFDDDAVRSITTEDGNISGTYSPVEPLTEFNEEGPNGTWTLEVHDEVITNGGTLNSWSITFQLSDTAPPTSFANDVMPIFVNNCMSCHNTTKQRTFKVDDVAYTYDNITTNSLINTTSPDLSLILIKGNNSESNHNGGDQLSDENSTIVRNWIEEGGLNN